MFFTTSVLSTESGVCIVEESDDVIDLKVCVTPALVYFCKGDFRLDNKVGNAWFCGTVPLYILPPGDSKFLFQSSTLDTCTLLPLHLLSIVTLPPPQCYPTSSPVLLYLLPSVTLPPPQCYSSVTLPPPQCYPTSSPVLLYLLPSVTLPPPQCYSTSSPVLPYLLPSVTLPPLQCYPTSSPVLLYLLPSVTLPPLQPYPLFSLPTSAPNECT